jgi:dTMP kinase
MSMEDSIMRYFICLSGLDGSGKTTQCKLLCKNLMHKNPIYYTFGDVEDGNRVNRATINYIKKVNLHLDNNQKYLIKSAFHMYFDIKRLTNKEEFKNKIVVMDRYVETIYAHAQLYGVDLNIINEIIEEVYVKPDLYIFLDLKPETCYQRITKRSKVMSKHEELSNLIKLDGLYEEIVKRLDITVIDGNKASLEISKDIAQYINLK